VYKSYEILVYKVFFRKFYPSHINIAGGYPQTKWVAEQRLRRAAEVGVVGPVMILRPGLITSVTNDESCRGATNMRDWLTRFVHGAITLGGHYVFEDVLAMDDGAMHVAPVSHAAECVCVFAVVLHGRRPIILAQQAAAPITCR
jgi:thioester reductase-like protein